MSDDPDEIRPGANRLAALDPENLLRITVDEISPLLRREYAALERRSGELEDRAAQWLSEHQKPGHGTAPVIADDNDLAKLSDFLIQLRDHAGMNGEVDTARKKVKEQPYRAVLAIDAHFNNLSRPLATWIEQATTWQKDYLRRQRAAEAARQQAEAQRMRDIAAAEIVAARKAATVDAEQRAMEAEQAADEAQERITTAPEPIRVRSTIGSTTSGGTVWDFEVTNLRELCVAIGRGDVPVTFIQPNDQAIRAAIRGKPPLRTCSGVRIFEDVSIRRRG